MTAVQLPETKTTEAESPQTKWEPLPGQPYLSEEERQQRREAAIALLQSWRDAEGEEAREQCETYDYLVEALNSDLLPGQRRRI